MFRIIIQCLCLDGYSEMFPDVDYAELVLECTISLALLCLFDCVDMREISLTALAASLGGPRAGLLSIDATGCLEVLDELDTLDVQVESLFCSVLVEFFSSVHVRSLSVRREQGERQAVTTLAQRA